MGGHGVNPADSRTTAGFLVGATVRARAALVGLLVLGVCCPPPAADAQQPAKVPRVGVLAPGVPPLEHFEAFRQGLRDLGHVEGQTIILEPRWERGKPDRYATLATELVRLNVDIIVAGTTPATLAARNATATIPIVMAAIGAGDPVELGLVASLARPGGNVTGLILQTHELAGKRLELLKETVPGVSRVALFWNPQQVHLAQVKEHEAAARSLGVRLQPVEVRGAEDFEGAFQAAGRGRAGALIMAQASLFSVHRARLADLALHARLPTISGETGFAEAGGLMNYGPNIVDSWRRAAAYVDKILKGAKPGDLPIERPTKFELVINLKTSKALGLAIPPSVLIRADRAVQ